MVYRKWTAITLSYQDDNIPRSIIHVHYENTILSGNIL